MTTERRYTMDEADVIETTNDLTGEVVDRRTVWSPEKTTTWGDCPDSSCPFYGRLVYNIEPGDSCIDKNGGRGCFEWLRWWDRWHDGQHRGEEIAECVALR